jgi:hypothetical protein
MPEARDESASQAPERRHHRWRGAVLVELFALVFPLGCFPMADFDVWWHLRTGQFILEHSAVPRFDIYTYTNAGRPWIDIYWLFQVIVALLYRAGGVSALVLLKALAALRARRRSCRSIRRNSLCGSAPVWRGHAVTTVPPGGCERRSRGRLVTPFRRE